MLFVLLFDLYAYKICLNCFITFEHLSLNFLSWIFKAPLGPPFALIQGTLEAMGTTFKKIPREACPTIRRGSVAWIGSGPEFFISLANHGEWKNAYTVFGSVLKEDMEIVERIAQLPTRPDDWNKINVSVLEDSVSLLFKRIKTSHWDLSLKVKNRLRKVDVDDHDGVHTTTVLLFSFTYLLIDNIPSLFFFLFNPL